MRQHCRTLVLAVGLPLLACSSSPERLEPDKVAEAVRTESLGKDPRTFFVGPTLTETNNQAPRQGRDSVRYQLRGWLEPETGISSHELAVEIAYPGERRFYEIGGFKDGVQFGLTEVQHENAACAEGNPCNQVESFSVPLTRRFLAIHMTSGFMFQVGAVHGQENRFTLPAEYVQGYLQATVEADQP